MLSKNKIKFINSLYRKKTRDKNGLFIAEGEKTIKQLIDADYGFHAIVGTEEKAPQFSGLGCEIITASHAEIKKISLFKTPQPVIAICFQQKNIQPTTRELNNELSLALDDIQDPGNLGTIIRLASWFGIKNIICSLKSADCYNPKVIQSTMGAIAHVNIFYTKLEDFLSRPDISVLPKYGTFLEGENIYTTQLTYNGIIVMGNEGNGISSGVAKQISHKLFIPSFANANVESLNVSVAASIVCSEFKRRALPA